jgi:hypothetical protein
MCTTFQFIEEGLIQAHSSQSIATIHTPGIRDVNAWQILKGEKTRGLLVATSVRFFLRYIAWGGGGGTACARPVRIFITMLLPANR